MTDSPGSVRYMGILLTTDGERPPRRLLRCLSRGKGAGGGVLQMFGRPARFLYMRGFIIPLFKFQDRRTPQGGVLFGLSRRSSRSIRAWSAALGGRSIDQPGSVWLGLPRTELN